MTATHDLLLNIQTILSPPPVQQQGLSTPLFISSDSDLSPDPVRVYNSIQAVDNDADLSASAKAAALVAFSQQPQPASLWIAGLVDGVNPPYTLTQALDRVLDTGRDVIAVATDVRVTATIATFASACAAREVHYVFQTSDADWLTAGVPSAFSATAGLEYISGVYHPTDAEFADVAWLTKNLVYDPDVTSRNWTGQVRGIAPYAVTDTQYTNLTDNNINFSAPFGPVETYIAPGVMLTGRPASEILSVQWYRRRLLSRWTRVFLQYDAAGLKIPVDVDGQEILAAEARAQFDQGVATGHFTDGQIIITLPAITSADRDAQRIPIQIALMTTTGAVRVASTVTFSRDPIVTIED